MVRYTHAIYVLVALQLFQYAATESNPDESLTTPELIAKYGYPVETHTVTTADGYILTMHRIPDSKKCVTDAVKKVVFLQHGLMCSSADWIILGPEKSLGYLLADACYDVWMGNARGNTYSKDHTTYSTTSNEFWDFSWHEMGIYDLPAEIDYVLAQTGQAKLYYVGHSMGTTMFYVLTSMKPEYNSKIQHMTSLAPVAFMKHVASPLVQFAANFPGGQLGMEAIELLGVGELMPSNAFMKILADVACSEGSVLQPMCENILFLLVGYDPSQLNETILPVILSHTPAGCSTKTVAHYAQEISAVEGGFRLWDFYAGNLAEYGSLFPPSYDLAAISTPVSLFYSDNDLFGDPTDVHELNTALGNSLGEYRVPLSSFAHMDFLWANDVKTLVNDEVLEAIQNN